MYIHHVAQSVLSLSPNPFGFSADDLSLLINRERSSAQKSKRGWTTYKHSSLLFPHRLHFDLAVEHSSLVTDRSLLCLPVYLDLCVLRVLGHRDTKLCIAGVGGCTTVGGYN